MSIDIGMWSFMEYFVQNPSILIGIFLLYCFIFGVSIFFSGPRPGKNPFSANHVRPVEPLVTDQSLRDKVLKQKFKPYKVPDDKLDAIVIGSGIGGLTTAVLLAKAGKKVLVLEQHDQAGGCCHTFHDKGFEFDTGIHYIGKMYEGHPDKVLTDQLTGGGVDYPKMEPIYDIVKIGDPAKCRSYGIPSGKDKLEKNLIQYFPKEEEAVKKFMHFLDVSKGGFTGYFAMKIMPKRFAQFLTSTGLYKLLFKSYAKYHGKSLKSFLDEITDDEELKCVLSYCWGDYGVAPSRSSLVIHQALFNHYSEGSYYIRGGSSEVVYQTVQNIEKNDGKVLVQAPVQKILTNEQGHAIGVLVGRGNNSCEIFANTIISDAGVSNTFLRLLPKEIAVKSSYYPTIKKVGESISFLSMFVGLDGTTEELGLKSQNIWAFTGPNVEEITNDYINMSVEDAAQSEVPLMFVSFPSAKDPSWPERFPGKSNMLIITVCPYEWFERWEDGKIKHRGGDYEGLKSGIGRQLLNQCIQMFPQIEDKIVYTDIGTPVSNKYYLGFDKGEMYGLDHALSRFSPEVSAILRPQTDIPGLYLTGQDIATCGFTGAMFGGLFSAGAVLNRSLHKDLEKLVTEIRQTQNTKKE